MCRWRVRARLRVGYIIIVIITRLPDRPADTLRIFPAVFPPMLLQQGMIGRQPLWSAPPLVPFFFLEMPCSVVLHYGRRGLCILLPMTN